MIRTNCNQSSADAGQVALDTGHGANKIDEPSAHYSADEAMAALLDDLTAFSIQLENAFACPSSVPEQLVHVASSTKESAKGVTPCRRSRSPECGSVPKPIRARALLFARRRVKTCGRIRV